METVTLTIDGREVTVEKGKTVLQAAIEHGITVPYYCFHPGISVDGSCRVCIVKIEKMGKLQTSCSTACTDGMVVHTRTPDVVEARAGVLEFLLINHPLDCPVCDKGGECPLQDFSYSFGPDQSRMEFPRRTFDGEGVKADVDFGPTLMLNRNRCILCTRCVRFMREIDGDAQIGIIHRGYHSEIATYREEGVHSLLSGNLMDVCPVGAITTKDYRFKSRPWDNPEAVDTICTMCAKGCNTTAWLKAKPEWAKGARLVRFTPRFEPDVNGYWMCDIGRFGYHWIEGDDRLRKPLARGGDGVQSPVTWHDLMVRLRHELDIAENREGFRFLVSAHAANEELFVVGAIAQGLAGDKAPDIVTMSWRYQPKSQPENTKFKVPAADAPNVNGARDLGFNVGAGNNGPADVSALRAEVEAGKVAVLYVLDPGPDGSLGDVSWILDAKRAGKLPMLIVEGVLLTELAKAADFVLPGASFVEKDASYTNEQGRVQAAARAIPLPGEAQEDWRILLQLANALSLKVGVTSDAEIRAEIARGLSGHGAYANLPTLAFARPVVRKNWLEGSNPSERWKWDVLFQDLPPVKGAVDPSSLPPPPGVIPLTPVRDK
jgi:NADH-quinone oxidoreductase subunit G